MSKLKKREEYHHKDNKYNIINFAKKKKKNQPLDSIHEKPPKAMHQTLSKDFLSKKGQLSPVDKELFTKVKVVKNPHDYESVEKEYNFRLPEP